MARKSSDSGTPDPVISQGGKNGPPVYAVVSDPSFFDRIRTECTNVPPEIDFYPDAPKLLTYLGAARKTGLAFVVFAERFGHDIDISGVRQLRIDFPQIVPLVILEACEPQCEHRLQAVGVHRIMLPPFDQIDLAREIDSVAPNIPSFKRHPDLMRRGQIRMDFLIPSDLSYVLGINYEISMLLKEFGFSQPDARINIPLACDEAITNAIIHGNKSQPEKKVNVQIYLSHSRFRIRVRDQGAGFDFDSVADPRSGDNVHRASGRGVFLMRKIMDTVEYKEGGRVLELEKLNPAARGNGPGSTTRQ